MTKFSMFKLSLIAAVLTLASTTSPLHAQVLEGKTQFNVPFAFEVGHDHFAPGVYTVSMLHSSTLQVNGFRNSGFALVMPAWNGKTIARNKIVFHQIGGEYFLAEVWTAKSTDHLVAQPLKAEKRAMVLAAGKSAAPAVDITVATNTR